MDGVRQEIVDKISFQDITEDFYLKPHVENNTSPVQPSYWAYALNGYGLSPVTKQTSKFVRIDAYWDKVGSILDATGNFKYTQLLALNAFFSLSHVNSYIRKRSIQVEIDELVAKKQKLLANKSS